MKKIFIGLFFLICNFSISQEEASNWYFGSNAGIKFNSDGTVTNLTDGMLDTVEGCTTISDNNGDLLFYTDGITVFNRLHQPMPNNGLFGDPSSTQSAIVVPKPDDLNIYYIFTVDTSIGTDADLGFNYSTVDLTLNGGLGDITSKNINLLQDSSEKISAVLKDCESKSIWVITFANSTGLDLGFFDTFFAYEVSNTGVNTMPVTSSFNFFIGDPRGYLKLSPDGTKLACANSRDGLYLFDFDKATGIVSNPNFLNINFTPPPGKTQAPYGVEFSQNNELLYVTTSYNPIQSEFDNPNSQYGALLQYDLTAPDINASEIVIDERQTYRGALQLGPNGKIYRSMSSTYNNGLPFLSVINNPNQIGTACNYNHNTFTLSSSARQGLPPFISSFFAEKIDIVRNGFETTYLSLCIGESYTLIAEDIPGATYTWSRDGIILTENDFDLEIFQPGLYDVLIEPNTGDCDILEGEALVEYFDVPITNPINDILICDTDNDGNFLFDFSLQTQQAFGAQDPLTYNIKYYVSQEDADLNQNEINLPFINTQNPQIIYTRLGITGNNNCFDSSQSFTIQVFNTPIANTVNPIEICDTAVMNDSDVTNGQTDINLNQFDIDILGSLDASLYSMSYYKSLLDAENKTNPLSFIYFNQTPFNESIFGRIENVLNNNCFEITPPIEITINPLPLYTNTSLIQCDEDGIKDNLTSYNLLEAERILTNDLTDRELKFFTSQIDAENSLNEIIIATNFQNTSNPQTIYVQIINTNTSCFSIGELILETSSTQINDYFAPAICDELNSEDGLGTFNLNDFTTDIQTLNGISLPISYYETYEDALSEENELISPYNNTTPYSQTLYARAENDNACYGISEVILTINELPNIITENLEYYCLNTFPETISINAAVLNDSPNNYTYEWSTDENTYEIQINEVGAFNVTVTNANGCSKQRTVTIEPSNIATFQTINVIDMTENNMVTVITSGEGVYEYSLVNSDNQIIFSYQESNVFENVSPGIYKVFVRDIKNDCGIVNDGVSVIGFPKFFTPNNDGFNDTWQVYGVSNQFQPNTKILIFNRFGKLIKELDPSGIGWDGTFRGNILPSDDYWFSVKLEDGRIFKNHFTLKR